MTNHPPSTAVPSHDAVFSTTTGTSIETGTERHGFDFRHFWHSLVERIWIVVLCLVAGIFLALGYLARTPKLYQGHVVLEVEFAEPTVVNSEDSSMRMRSMFLASQEALRTIEQNLTNRSLLARVARAEGLADDGGKALLGHAITATKERSTSPSPASSNANAAASEKNIVGMTFTPLEEALGGAISGMVKPVIRRGTRLIDLYVTNRDPAMAQRLSEAVGREYIRYSIERRASFSQDTLRYLLEEEERLKANLQKSEAAVAEYKEKTPDALQLGGGAAATGSQTGAGAGGGGARGGLVEDKLQELTSKLTAAKADRLRLEGELKQIEGEGENVDALLAIPSIAASPQVLDRRRDVAQLEAVVAQLAQRYKDKHPKMTAARAALSEARDALKRAVLSLPAVLRNMLEQAQATEASLTSAVKEQEKAALALNKAAIGYQEFARQAETDRALYESVLRQIKETNLTKDVKTNAVSVIEHSPLPGAPVSPKPFKAIALGLLGGLAAGLAFVYVADLLDRSIKTVDQAEQTLRLPVLAAVPEVTKQEAAETVDTPPGVASYRLVAEAPEGAAAEAFRNLRASLSLLGPEQERKVFLFTSAAPNEGKSFTSANYSLALAQQGHRVLLIDGDLRRPSLHKIFRDVTAERGTEEIVPGIVDYLVGATDLKTAARGVSARALEFAADAITATGGTLFVLTGGRRAPNPAELLSGPSFGRLVEDAARSFDRVVIDSAPVLAVSDTLLMVPLVQTVCVVVRAASTPRNAVHRALGMLTGAGVRPAGIILNRLPRRHGSGYYYYYASPGYGRGEGSYAGRYTDRHTERTTSRRQNGAES
ncbi:MAG: polysaccharide biosynthesis transport protein [Verrucomicrobiota bacterium]|jgi:capsular exopolysaccharide synthesis family protein